jgi:hypothetical protein
MVDHAKLPQMRQVSVAAVTDLNVQVLCKADINLLGVTLVCPMYLAGRSPSPLFDWRCGSEAMSPPRTFRKDLPPPLIDPAKQCLNIKDGNGFGDRRRLIFRHFL